MIQFYRWHEFYFTVRTNGEYDRILRSHMVSDMNIPEIRSNIFVT